MAPDSLDGAKPHGISSSALSRSAGIQKGLVKGSSGSFKRKSVRGFLPTLSHSEGMTKTKIPALTLSVTPRKVCPEEPTAMGREQVESSTD